MLSHIFEFFPESLKENTYMLTDRVQKIDITHKKETWKHLINAK